MEQQLDLLLPPEMALKAEEAGVSKAHMGWSKTIILAILAGSFIAFGGIFFTVVTSGDITSFGISRFAGGIAFSLGLILVILGGAELFTGNNLIVMAWANRKISFALLLKNWLLVYIGNSIGALAIAFFVLAASHPMAGKGSIGLNMLQIAHTKCAIAPLQAVASGILCNILVCLAVWLCFSAKDVSGKIASIIFPVSAFVAAGFEHCIANMYFLPLGLLIKGFAPDHFWLAIGTAPADYPQLTLSNMIFHNLIPVTIGNIIGGAVLVGLVYWFVYLRKTK
jgi:formate/nitrite transporter